MGLSLPASARADLANDDQPILTTIVGNPAELEDSTLNAIEALPGRLQTDSKAAQNPESLLSPEELADLGLAALANSPLRLDWENITNGLARNELLLAPLAVAGAAAQDKIQFGDSYSLVKPKKGLGTSLDFTGRAYGIGVGLNPRADAQVNFGYAFQKDTRLTLRVRAAEVSPTSAPLLEAASNLQLGTLRLDGRVYHQPSNGPSKEGAGLSSSWKAPDKKTTVSASAGVSNDEKSVGKTSLGIKVSTFFDKVGTLTAGAHAELLPNCEPGSNVVFNLASLDQSWRAAASLLHDNKTHDTRVNFGFETSFETAPTRARQHLEISRRNAQFWYAHSRKLAADWEATPPARRLDLHDKQTHMLKMQLRNARSNLARTLVELEQDRARFSRLSGKPVSSFNAELEAEVKREASLENLGAKLAGY